MRRLEYNHTRGQGTKIFRCADGAAIIEACQTIVNDKSLAKVNGVAVDLFSASAIVTVDNILQKSETQIGKTNAIKFRTFTVDKMARVALKLIS